MVFRGSLNKDNAGLVSALFILLAASIASASVMKSIEATKELKKQETIKDEKGKILFLTTICFHIQQDIESLLEYEADNNVYKCDICKKISTDISSIIKKWEKLYHDKFFPLFIAGETAFIYLTNKEINKLERKITELENSEKGCVTFKKTDLEEIIKLINPLLIILADILKEKNGKLNKEN